MKLCFWMNFLIPSMISASRESAQGDVEETEKEAALGFRLELFNFRISPEVCTWRLVRDQAMLFTGVVLSD